MTNSPFGWLRRGGYLMVGFLISIALGSQPTSAQYIYDYQTNIIALGTSTWSGNYYVGNTNFADALVIESQGVLTTPSVFNSYVGYTAGSSNNSVLVTGTGSVWITTDSYIGYSGAGNILTISNGGSVGPKGSPHSSYVGYFASSSNNTVVITGPGSVWTNHFFLYAGYTGPGNSLVVSSGGKLAVSGSFYLGYFSQDNLLVVSNGGQVVDSVGSIGRNTSSSNNSVLVTGVGSVWSNGFSLEAGGYSAHNSLVISNGGLVVDVIGYVGSIDNVGSDSNSFNTVRVTDGAVWRNISLYIGYQGSSNALVVAGGSVYATNLVVGAASATCDNLIELDSGSLIVTNATGSGVLDVQHGELIVDGGILQANTLVMTNPCASFVHTGGTLIVGNVILDPNTFRIVSVTPQGNDVLVTWMMGPGATNTLQAAAGDGSGGYSTNGFTDIFVVTNNPSVGTITNYLDLGAATNTPARYYRARLIP